MFDATFSVTCYVSVMSKGPFEFLLHSLGFYDKGSHYNCKQNYQSAAIRNLWQQFIESCRNNYSPVMLRYHRREIIRSQRVLFILDVCLPPKPRNMASKSFTMSKQNISSMLVHLGKSTNTAGLPLDAYFTKELTKAIHLQCEKSRGRIIQQFSPWGPDPRQWVAPNIQWLQKCTRVVSPKPLTAYDGLM